MIQVDPLFLVPSVSIVEEFPGYLQLILVHAEAALQFVFSQLQLVSFHPRVFERVFSTIRMSDNNSPLQQFSLPSRRLQHSLLFPVQQHERQ